MKQTSRYIKIYLTSRKNMGIIIVYSLLSRIELLEFTQKNQNAECSDGTGINILGVKWVQEEILGRVRKFRNVSKKLKIYHFHAEMFKFGLTLTYFKLC